MINITIHKIISDNFAKLKINNDKPKKNQEINDNKISSPKTLKKTLSNENFIKFQWGWII